MTSRLLRTVIIHFVCIPGLISSPTLLAQELLFPSGSAPNSSAVDAKGARHRGSDYSEKRAPWMDDTIKAVTPDYPYEYRSRHLGGSGLFRIMLDVNTGSVNEVTVLKSTGFSMLDSCAIRALRKWRWKSGRWKEISIPITFRVRSVPSRPSNKIDIMRQRDWPSLDPR
jgi:TonB family protein